MVMPGDNVGLVIELITPVAMDKGLRFAIREGGRTWRGNGNGDIGIECGMGIRGRQGIRGMVCIPCLPGIPVFLLRD